MEKDFLKLRIDDKKAGKGLLVAGLILTIFLGADAYGNTMLENSCELLRKEAGAGDYEQEVIADTGEETVVLKLNIDERQLTREEADEEFAKAGNVLDQHFTEMFSEDGEKEAVLFPEQIEGTSVEAEWIWSAEEYYHTDGTRREDVKLSEPVEVIVKAILSCQKYTQDYETAITIYPKELSTERELLALIAQSQEQTAEGPTLILPTEYNGNEIRWKKPMDFTFLYFLILILCGMIFLKIGRQYDEKLEKKKRMEQLEYAYPQIIGKFAMLLSAGLNIRSAWERIVKMYHPKEGAGDVVYEEMRRALQELEKGIPEAEVYIAFGDRTGHIHYKKLMNLFASAKKRGNLQLQENMNREMLCAWEERKHKIRQQGERIGTKLLIPMMGMLAVVFCMILVPAFLSFQV